jgi:hypothetical protein
MRILLPIIQYFIIATSFIQGWLIVFISLVLYFSWRYSAAYLIPLAIFLDGYFGHFALVPWLSFAAIIWYGLFDLIKPRLITHTKTIK